MKKKITDTLFASAVFLLLLLPSLYLLDVEESFVKLYGAERVPQGVPLTLRSYREKTFQKTFDEIFSKKFFLRKSFTKCKNQLYAWSNFGYFYFPWTIFGGRDGWLFGQSYLACYYGNKPVDEKAFRPAFRLLGDLADEFGKRDIDFIYVLATDKVSMHPEMLPAFHSLYLKGRSETPHAAYSEILTRYDVPHLNSHAYLSGFKGKQDLFPASGVHWNSRAACLTVAEALRVVNRGKEPQKRYIVPEPVRYDRTKHPHYDENDLGRLINVFYGPPDAGCDPIFPPLEKANDCEVIVMGDSFSEQVARAFMDSRSFKRVVNYSNRVPSAEVVRRDLRGVKLFVLVYTTPKLLNPNERHGDLKKIFDVLVKEPAPKGKLIFGKKLFVNDLDARAVGGFYVPEKNGRWAGERCSFELPVRPGSDIEFTFEGWPLTGDQSVRVVNRRGEELAKLPLPADGRYKFTVPAREISPDNVLSLRFEFSRAARPKNVKDPRVLSFFFRSIKLSRLKR